MTDDLRAYYDEKAVAFDELAATYENPDPYKRLFYRTRFESVLQALDPRPGEHVLEIGCGIGVYTKELAERGVRVTATEYAPNYLRQAKDYVGEALSVDTTFQVEDAQNLSFGDSHFDRVLMTEVIEHLPDPERALREAHRTLRPQGVLALSTPSRFSPLNLAYAVKRKIRGYAFNEHLHEFTPRGLRQLVQPWFAIESFMFANFCFPYPLDSLYTRLGTPGLGKIEALERRLGKAPLAQRLGWTMIVRARKR